MRLQIKSTPCKKNKKVIKAVKENDVSDETEIVLSTVIHRENQDVENEINELNKKHENVCKRKGIRFIDNSNIKSSSLNTWKLHLNNGTTLLTKYFAKVVHFD